MHFFGFFNVFDGFRMDQLMNSCIFYASMCFDRDELSVLMMTSDDL